MADAPLILIADDEPNVRTVLMALLEEEGYAVVPAATGREALDLVRAQDPDLVLTDLAMPDMDGMELLTAVRKEFSEIPVVLLTAHGTVENAVQAMKSGAFDFLTKPFEREEVTATLQKALGQGARRRRDVSGPVASEGLGGMVGAGAAISEVFRLIERVAPAPSNVLITGETGTGKELVASAIHELSPRARGSMICVNCGALPENLVESDLFGHEKGAFTGAVASRPGRFELADRGTLFLDEIGELAAEAQAKLLRVLENGELQRVGGSTPRRVDVRVIAATNRDLEEEARQGNFREDLLFRLRVVEIPLPPLRERLEDLPALVSFFLDKHAARLKRSRPAIAESALGALAERDWPGNVRELENTVERALLLSDGGRLEAQDFGLAPGAAKPPENASDLKSAVKDVTMRTERRMIRAALDATEGNVTHAAERLGLSRRGLQLKMKELGLRSPE